MTGSAAASDGELAQAAAEGDEHAFAQLVSRHKQPLYRLLRRHTGSSDEAYEAIQEAFIAAWRALKHYDPQRPFNLWLRTIALNKARDRGRRRYVRRIVFGSGSLDSDEARNAPDPSRGPEASASTQEETARLEIAISQLPNTLKEPLLLVALDGLTQSEAAATLGVSVKTLEMRLYRARLKLAQSVQRDLTS